MILPQHMVHYLSNPGKVRSVAQWVEFSDGHLLLPLSPKDMETWNRLPNHLTTIQSVFHDLPVQLDMSFERLLVESQCRIPGFEEALELELKRICLTLRRTFTYLQSCKIETVKSSDEGMALVKEAAHYLRLHNNRHVPLSELAKHTLVSSSYLSHLFRAHYGRSPGQYALQLRMEQAQSMLRDGNLSITKIADKLGYQSIAYFSRAFKRSHGISPSKFRKNLDKAADTTDLESVH